MICITIKVDSKEGAERDILQALPLADLIELRLDFWKEIDFPFLKALKANYNIPMIFTLRRSNADTMDANSEVRRQDLLLKLASLHPEYLDLEADLPKAFITAISSRYPAVNIIISYHNFDETPEDLEQIFSAMTKEGVWGYKMAVMAKNTIDTLRLIHFAKNVPGNKIFIAMGEQGQLSRIAGPIFGNAFTYASLDEKREAAPGQVSASGLLERYNYRSITSSTALYALIGDPIHGSISDVTHNKFFAHYGVDALYVKLPLAEGQLKAFLSYAKMLFFKGVSVTMPLKEKIIPYLDEISVDAKKIGAVNTLSLVEGKLLGSNTDGVGALNAIEGDGEVKGKRVVIIGAGGAAKAIAFEAHCRGAKISIVNRSRNRAEMIAEEVQGRAFSLDQMPFCSKSGYDILINTTPVDSPIEDEDLLPKTLVMDIKTKPKMGRLLQVAKSKGCSLVYGYKMFIEQALGQFKCWFHEDYRNLGGQSFMESVVLENLDGNS